MAYLFLLCLTLFLLTFFYFFAFNQDLIAPPVVMSVMFLISSVFALINVQNWNIEYSGLAYLLIISGIVVFSMPLLALNSPSLNTKIKVTDRLIDIQFWKIALTILVDLLILYLYRKEIYNLVLSSGYSGSNIQWFFRNSTSYEGELTVRTSIRFLIRIIDVSAYIFGYTFINNFIIYGHRRSKDLLLLAPFLIFISKTLLSGGRQDIIKILIAYVVITYIQQKRKVGWDKVISHKYMRLGFVGLIAGIPAFYYSLFLAGRSTTRTIFESVSTYLGGPIQHFNQYVKNPVEAGEVFGSESLVPVLNILGKLGLVNYNRTIHLEFRRLGITIGNVYTFFRRPWHDFGLVGMYIFSFAVGVFFAFYYLKLRKSQASFELDIHTIIYSYFFYWIFLSSIDQYSFTTISLFTLVFIVLVYLLAFFYWNLDFHRGKLVIKLSDTSIKLEN
ncbi:polysaccharide polymerase Cps19aI [Streptococcus pneumoniae]|nr:polysaccharide polymerase Cps19aI [Streptococcus pneumoniae]